MTAHVLLLCALAGIFFGAWPLVMRYAKEASNELHYVFTCLLLQVGSIAVFLPMLKDRVELTHLFTWGVAIGLSAGILNGFGQLAFQNLITSSANDSDLEISRFIVVVVMIQVALGVLGGRFLFNEPFTLNKALGLALAVAAVFLMKSR